MVTHWNHGLNVSLNRAGTVRHNISKIFNNDELVVRVSVEQDQNLKKINEIIQIVNISHMVGNWNRFVINIVVCSLSRKLIYDINI